MRQKTLRGDKERERSGKQREGYRERERSEKQREGYRERETFSFPNLIFVSF